MSLGHSGSGRTWQTPVVYSTGIQAVFWQQNFRLGWPCRDSSTAQGGGGALGQCRPLRPGRLQNHRARSCGPRGVWTTRLHFASRLQHTTSITQDADAYEITAPRPRQQTALVTTTGVAPTSGRLQGGGQEWLGQGKHASLPLRSSSPSVNAPHPPLAVSLARSGAIASGCPPMTASLGSLRLQR